MNLHGSAMMVALLVCLLPASGDVAARGAAVAGGAAGTGALVRPFQRAPIGVVQPPIGIVRPPLVGPRLLWRGHRSPASWGASPAVVEDDGYPVGVAPLGYAPAPYPAPVLDPDDELAPRPAPLNPLCGWRVYRVPAEQGGGMKSITVSRC